MIIISSSTIYQLLSCPRKFILGYATPNRTPSLATEVGTAVHQAMQAGTEASDRAMHHALCALLRRFPYELFLNASPKERANRSLLSCATAIETALAQLDQHGLRLAEVNGRKASELDFLLTLDTNREFGYSGSIDSVFVGSDGRVWITDYKTTTKDIELAALQYSKSLQASIYAIVVASALGIPATDICYQYVIIRLDSQLGEVRFERKQVTAEGISEAKKYLRIFTNTLRECWHSEYFPPQADSCTAFKRPCWYANQCNATGLREAIASIKEMPDTYRYAYLDTGKTDYDIRGELIV